MELRDVAAYFLMFGHFLASFFSYLKLSRVSYK
jgi:hypothetical protein